MANAAKTSATLLVVESDVFIRMPIAAYLRECGYRVIEAVNGEEALAVLQQSDLVIDAVLSAVEVPGAIDGFRLRQWLREHRPDVQVIMAGTVKRTAEAVGDLCDEGPFLTRPYDPQLVENHIRQLLAGRQRNGDRSGGASD